MGLLAVAVGALIVFVNRLPLVGVASLTVALLAVGAIAFGLLVARSRNRPEPALPLRELGDPVLRRAMLLGCIGQTAFFGVLILAPIVAARAHHISGVQLGLLLLPMAILIALVSPRGGLLVERIGRRPTTWVSLTVIGSGAAFLAWVGPDAPVPVLEIGLIVAGGGFGLLSAPLVNEVSRRFPDARRSVALGMYNLAFFIGSASGAAIATGFVQSGLELDVFLPSPLPGASTGLLFLALLPILALGYDRLRPAIGGSAVDVGPEPGASESAATASRMRP
jgi:predicted MFS family arabinose efflux permease